MPPRRWRLWTTCASKMAPFGADESVAQPLVIALGVTMGDEVVDGGPHETLGVRIQIRVPRR
jgi:hypothetical protein